jgi:small-conductance mechanosensitive channel
MDSLRTDTFLDNAMESFETNILLQIHEFLKIQLFSLQNTPVTIFSLVMFLLFITIFSVMGKVLSKLLFNRLLAKVHMDDGVRFALMRFTNYIIIFIGIMISFQFIGIDLSGLAVIFGLLSVGIGFGLQNVTSNFISGLILLIERPIRIGDRIIVNDMEGDVSEINMRSTTIQSLENISIIVPNADFISGSVVNYSHGGDNRIRIRVHVGVAYGSNLEQVIICMRNAALAHPEVIKEPEPVVLLRDFGDSAWEMTVVSWIENAKKHYVVASEIRMNIVREFSENAIEIPFPQQDINFRNRMILSDERDQEKVKPDEQN